MKKMMTVFAALLFLGALILTGCAREEAALDTLPGQTESTAPAEVTETPTVPVEQDILYFVNEMEYNRLYSIREDGTDLQLVTDRRAYNARQLGDAVYFMSGSSLEFYHIPTQICTTLAENILSFEAEGDYIVYSTLTDSYGEIDLRLRNMSDGNDTSVAIINTGRTWLGYGRLYYSYYDYDSGTEVMCCYDLQTGEITETIGDFYYFGTLFPVEDGLYFEASTGDEDGWYFTHTDGSGYAPSELPLDGFSDPISISDNGILYQHWDTETFTDSLHHMSMDGQDTVLMTANSDSYFYIDKISNDRWMVQKTNSIGWGDTNEYGYHEKYAYQVDYFLLTADGTLTPLDVTGEAGSLFAGGDFPLLDSSTARIPVTTALYQLFVKNYGYEGPEPLCSTTHGAWLNIADRKVDLALLAAPTPEEQAYLEDKGVTVEMKLYGGDGLVFIGNAANPVTDLTHEQILAIYRGEITNWSQVGGPDHPIIAYYRDEQSGSQRLFKNLVFKGMEVPDFESMQLEGQNFWLMDDMSSIVDVILSEPYAIGYSIMTYLDEVYAEENLRVFSVEGTLPAPDTVADASYRYHTQGYLVIRSDEPADSPARRLFDWFGCPVSDDLLTDCGVSPLYESDT